MHRIAIIDDHTLFSSGLALLLDELEPPVSTDAFNSIDSFTVDINAKQYDLIILDFYLPGSDFFSNLDSLNKFDPSIPVMVVSASPSPSDRLNALSSGAIAFLNKSSKPSKLLDTVSSALSGECTAQISLLTLPESQNRHDLTDRQIEILTLVSKGYSNKDIGSMLDVSPETIKSHLKNIFLRIKVSNRMEAIEFIRQNGLL